MILGWLLEKIWWRRERIFCLVMNRWSCRGLCSVEEPESSVLCFCVMESLAGCWDCPLRQSLSQVGTSQFFMNIREEEACVVGDFVNHELWTFDLWDSVLLIYEYSSCVCGNSVEDYASILWAFHSEFGRVSRQWFWMSISVIGHVVYLIDDQPVSAID